MAQKSIKNRFLTELLGTEKRPKKTLRHAKVKFTQSHDA